MVKALIHFPLNKELLLQSNLMCALESLTEINSFEAISSELIRDLLKCDSNASSFCLAQGSIPMNSFSS